MGNKAPLAVAAVVGIVAIVGIKLATGGSDSSGTASRGGSDTTVAATPRAGCTTVTVAASSEKAALLSKLAADYNRSGRTVNGTCFGMRVTTAASGTAEAALARGWDTADGTRPDVWTP